MLSSGIHEADEARKAGTGPPGLSDHQEKLTELIVKAQSTLLPMKGKTVKDAGRLLRGLDKHNSKKEVWAFMEDLNVPPTNNAA